MVNVNEIVKKRGTHDASVKNFLRKLKKSFRKKRDLFTQSRARKTTGSHPIQIKKWIPELVEQHKLRKVTAYFLGCPPTELIVLGFDFGQVAICPTCNSELLWPPEDSKFVCENCGVEYVEDENGVWRYKPRIECLKEGVWSVESFTDPSKVYTVNTLEKSCTCPHHYYRKAYCKHMKKVDDIVASIKKAWIEAIRVGREYGVTVEQGLRLAMEGENETERAKLKNTVAVYNHPYAISNPA